LTVVTPLYQFAKKLPRYTKQTKRISDEAIAVLQILQKTVEPDELLFSGLPQALGLTAITTERSEEQLTNAKELKARLVKVLREIHGAYDALLTEGHQLIFKAFGVRSEETKLREDLQVRCRYLVGQCIEPTLKRFMLAVLNPEAGDRQWLESLLMIIADKPAESWRDEDVTAFEVSLANLVRRFRNLEALQKDVEAKGEGFEARRITMTRPDGHEANMVVWVDKQRREQAQQKLNEILESLAEDDSQLQQALLMQLTEKLLQSMPSEHIVTMKSKRGRKSKKSSDSQAG
ncbi:MAG: hypothetical protein WBB82_01675, partial [Limnothrix sp.]